MPRVSSFFCFEEFENGSEQGKWRGGMQSARLKAEKMCVSTCVRNGFEVEGRYTEMPSTREVRQGKMENRSRRMAMAVG